MGGGIWVRGNVFFLFFGEMKNCLYFSLGYLILGIHIFHKDFWENFFLNNGYHSGCYISMEAVKGGWGGGLDFLYH